MCMQHFGELCMLSCKRVDDRLQNRRKRLKPICEFSNAFDIVTSITLMCLAKSCCDCAANAVQSRIGPWSTQAKAVE